MVAKYIGENLYKSPESQKFVRQYMNGGLQRMLANRSYRQQYRAADAQGQQRLRQERALAEALRNRQKLTPEQIYATQQRIAEGDLTGARYSTGISLEKSIDQYPYDMQNVIDGYVEAVDENILAAAEEHRSGNVDGFRREKVTTPNQKFYDDVYKETGVDVSNEDVYINSNAFRHIEKRHGINGRADNSMANLNDLARVGFVINNADSIELLRENGNPVYSTEFSTADGKPAPLVLIKKKINGTYYCVVAATDGKWNRTWVVTSFINKKEGLTQILHAEMSALGTTSETPLASRPSDIKLPQSEADVNTQYMQNGINYSAGNSRLDDILSGARDVDAECQQAIDTYAETEKN